MPSETRVLVFSAYSRLCSSDIFAFFCDSFLSLAGTIEPAVFLLVDEDLPRPAPLVTPPVTPTAVCVVITGVTASVTETEVGVAKPDGAIEDDDEVVAVTTPDGAVDAAAAATGGDAATLAADTGETAFAKDFFLSSAKSRLRRCF